MKCRTCGKYLDPFADDTLGEFCWEHSMSNPKNKTVKSEPAEGAEAKGWYIAEADNLTYD